MILTSGHTKDLQQTKASEKLIKLPKDLLNSKLTRSRKRSKTRKISKEAAMGSSQDTHH